MLRRVLIASTAAARTGVLAPGSDPGLSAPEARARLALHGPNRLVPEEQRPSGLGWVLRAFADPMVLLLLVASAAYLALGETLDGIVTLLAVLPIALVTLVLERRAEKALAELRGLAAPTAMVVRDGETRRVPALELVPGDLVLITEGDVIPADGALVRGAGLLADESALTGESHPVLKSAGGESELLAGTTLVSGRGLLRVARTGSRTRYGAIGTLLAETRAPETPLQRVVRGLVLRLAVVAAVFCAGVVAVELVRGADWGTALIAGVALAIAAIPEEFPMVFALYLALGAWRLARDRALIRRLAGVETLGATSVICTDKTGTLTLGRVEVSAFVSRDGEVLEASAPQAHELVRAAVLASEPEPFDPLDRAIARRAMVNGVDVGALHAPPLVRDHPFDPEAKYMTHVWRDGAGLAAYAKGALEGILARVRPSEATRAAALRANDALARRGMRVLAVAAGAVPEHGGDERAADEAGLRYLGLVAFSDPVRPGVAEALAECRAAGIRVLMVTGDHPVTASAVAAALGFADGPVVNGDDLDGTSDERFDDLVASAHVFARIRPEQKHRLVRRLRARGEVVAMTGDGTNDAPALREADIGVAMGRRGTEVARAAATLVLLDDDFATIVAAVRDGRRIFENLRRAFAYLIAFHTPLLVVAFVIPLLGAPLVLLPLTIVWLELILHPTVALVFEADPPAADLMTRPPRGPRASLLSARAAAWPLARGITLTAGVLGLYVWSLDRVPEDGARAMAIAALVVGQLLLVLTERAPNVPLWRGLTRNRILPVVLGLSALSLLVALHVPVIAEVLGVMPLAPERWALALGVAAITTLWSEPLKMLRRTG